MSFLRNGPVAAAMLGAAWMVTLAITVAVGVAFVTGEALRPSMLWSLLLGAVLGAGLLYIRLPMAVTVAVGVAIGAVLMVIGIGPILAGDDAGFAAQALAVLFLWAGFAVALLKTNDGLEPGNADRYAFETSCIRFLTGFGYIFFTAIVAIPFWVMLMTSFKSRAEQVANPLDFGIDFSKGRELFRSYEELFTQFDFGLYLANSFFISVITVIVTLLFAIPGAYAVARLRFSGQAAFSRGILLIYMVPMIVLALPIYIAFSVTGLRNSIFGILLIYPVTTIPVALYMLQGYFRGLPAEVEEAGLMDGLSRLKVIWKITLPLSLPALASVSLYVFMIAWNEFLLAFMLLDDPSKFTLTRGIAALNSSEIPRQHLMAGSVIATVPIMALFLGLERFMTKGLTAGSVKG
ncbi:MAG: carbohydrate ABC transporter permease [Pseudomonadota bacterium]